MAHLPTPRARAASWPSQIAATAARASFAPRYTEVREQWEERFETRFGFWRLLTDRAVAALLDCGILFVRPKTPGKTVVSRTGWYQVDLKHQAATISGFPPVGCMLATWN